MGAGGGKRQYYLALKRSSFVTDSQADLTTSNMLQLCHFGLSLFPNETWCWHVFGKVKSTLKIILALTQDLSKSRQK